MPSAVISQKAGAGRGWARCWPTPQPNHMADAQMGNASFEPASSVLAPLDGLDVDALLHHFPQWCWCGLGAGRTPKPQTSKLSSPADHRAAAQPECAADTNAALDIPQTPNPDPKHGSHTAEAQAETSSVLAPLNGLDVNALLHHLPQR